MPEWRVKYFDYKVSHSCLSTSQHSINPSGSSGRRRSRTLRKPSAPSTRRPGHLAGKVQQVSCPPLFKLPSDPVTTATLFRSTLSTWAQRPSAPPPPPLVSSEAAQRKREVRNQGISNPDYRTRPRLLPLLSNNVHPSMARPGTQAQPGIVVLSPTTEASSLLLQTKTHHFGPLLSSFPIRHYRRTRSHSHGIIVPGGTATRILM